MTQVKTSPAFSAASAKTIEPLEEINARLSTEDAERRIQWAVETYGKKLILSTSFGTHSALMLYLVTQVEPQLPIVFIDTGYHFPETYRFAEELRKRFDLNLHTYVPRMTAAHQEAIYGKLWEDGAPGLDKYGRINKAEPMNRALRELGAEAWLSGLRRSQAKSREKLPVVDRQGKTCKIHPIIDWDERQAYYFMQKHDLPFHPLWEKGYVSIGDWHTTRPLEAGLSPEETRFNGVKRECGLHEASGQADWQI